MTVWRLAGYSLAAALIYGAIGFVTMVGERDSCSDHGLFESRFVWWPPFPRTECLDNGVWVPSYDMTPRGLPR